jgi:hypothetical protein
MKMEPVINNLNQGELKKWIDEGYIKLNSDGNPIGDSYRL